MTEYTKTTDDYFRDWFTNLVGYGYGTGESYTLSAIKTFFENIDDRGRYDYRALEVLLTPTVFWFLLDILCKNDVINYGTSPRVGWVAHNCLPLSRYFAEKTVDELYGIVCIDDPMADGKVSCCPDCCNCGPRGHQPGVRCKNPFWTPNRPV